MRTRDARVVFGPVVLLVCVLVARCAEGPGPVPVAPTPPPAAQPTPSPPPVTVYYAVSGIVYEETSAGKIPVAGVDVYCEICDPPLGHSLQVTDAKGAYRFAQAPQQTIYLSIAKPGYVLPNQPDQSGADGLGAMGTVGVVVGGDTVRDIQIAKK